MSNSEEEDKYHYVHKFEKNGNKYTVELDMTDCERLEMILPFSNFHLVIGSQYFDWFNICLKEFNVYKSKDEILETMAFQYIHNL